VKAATRHQIQLGGRRVEYRVVRSTAARRLRLRVGPNGVEVLQPSARHGEDLSAFLGRNEAWILDQLQRVERLRTVRRPVRRCAGEILFRGEPTLIQIESSRTRARGNVISCAGAMIAIQRGTESRTPVARSLEYWLRREARKEIGRHLRGVTMRVRQSPRRVYVMGQRTKWGNCSAGRNLSFNWRLILAPEFVLRYVVTHEAVHLAIPDHSAKFWLTVQSLCRETERARQWLCHNWAELAVDLDAVCKRNESIGRERTSLLTTPGLRYGAGVGDVNRDPV
jgi:predicted metal-dependent hydrolase